MAVAASWLASPLIALIRPAANAVAGDIWRRWRIGRRFDSREPSDDSPVVKKAIHDLEILIGSNALLTTSVAAILDELKSTGVLSLIARDAFYGIDSEGTRVYFEALFARHSAQISVREQRDASQRLYETIRFLLRESIRAQIDDDLLFIFDTFLRTERGFKTVAEPHEKIRAVVSEVRPEIAKRVVLSGKTLLSHRTDDSQPPSGLSKRDFPGWLYLTPEQLERQIKDCCSPRTTGHGHELPRAAMNSRGERYPSALCG
jgi:hypothetical protein